MTTPTPGRLFLIPNVIAVETQHLVIPPQVPEILKTLKYFLAEDVRTARRYFSSLRIFNSIEDLHFSVLNKDTKEEELPLLMKPVTDGYDLGVVSDSGCPGVADPGALAVAYAHQKKIQVVPLVGPSSLLLALMASGLNGQQFAFHGYIPVDAKEAAKVIRELERESRAKNCTQIVIETPYRTDALARHFFTHFHPDTRLCIAQDLTSPQQEIATLTIREWKLKQISFPKSPAIFLFLA